MDERLGIMFAPVGTIFLIGFGDDFVGAHQSAMQLAVGQFRPGHLMLDRL